MLLFQGSAEIMEFPCLNNISAPCWVMIWNFCPFINSSSSPGACIVSILQIASAVCGQHWPGYHSCSSGVINTNCWGTLVVAHCYHSISDTNSALWSEPPFVTICYTSVLISSRGCGVTWLFSSALALTAQVHPAASKVAELGCGWDLWILGHRCWETGGKSHSKNLLHILFTLLSLPLMLQAKSCWLRVAAAGKKEPIHWPGKPFFPCPKALLILLNRV